MRTTPGGIVKSTNVLRGRLSVQRFELWLKREGFKYFHRPIWYLRMLARVGGIPEAVEDGITGYIVATEDADQAAKRMIALSRDKELRDSLGSAAYDLVRRRFGIKDQIVKLISCYGIA
jgi:glycosyltransferase involved in cell wall biosynthesis